MSRRRKGIRRVGQCDLAGRALGQLYNISIILSHLVSVSRVDSDVVEPRAVVGWLSYLDSVSCVGRDVVNLKVVN